MIAFLLSLSLWVAGPVALEDQALGVYCAQTYHQQVRVAVSFGGYGDCVTATRVGGQDTLLRQTSSGWKVLARGGGWIDQPSMTFYGVPNAIAQRLYARKQRAYEEKFGNH